MERLHSAAKATGPWTAAKVLQALRTHYLMECSSTVSFPEIELRPHTLDDKFIRRADYLTVFCHGVSKNYRWAKDRQNLYKGWDHYPMRRLPPGWRTGFEIKVSRSDLQVDLKEEYKQQP